jgi:hypothetical protein
VRLVPVCLPGGHLPVSVCFVGDTPVEALRRQHAQFGFCHSAAVFGRVVPRRTRTICNRENNIYGCFARRPPGSISLLGAAKDRALAADASLLCTSAAAWSELTGMPVDPRQARGHIVVRSLQKPVSPAERGRVITPAAFAIASPPAASSDPYHVRTKVGFAQDPLDGEPDRTLPRAETRARCPDKRRETKPAP